MLRTAFILIAVFATVGSLATSAEARRGGFFRFLAMQHRAHIACNERKREMMELRAARMRGFAQSKPKSFARAVPVNATVTPASTGSNTGTSATKVTPAVTAAATKGDLESTPPKIVRSETTETASAAPVCRKFSAATDSLVEVPCK